MKRNNIQLYLNKENTCLAIPRKYSTCLLKENYLSEFGTEEEKELAMENLLLLDEVPTKDSKRLVNSGDLANVLENLENGINSNIENLSTEIGDINEEIEGINEEIGDIKDNINTIETNINDILNEVNSLNIETFNKYYDPENFSGMGKIYLLKNIVNGINLLVLNMLEDDEGNPLTHTIFVIQYDYYLDNKTIHIPSNCVLLFEGGSLNEGTLVGDNTIIVATKTEIFSNIIIDGTWNIPEITSAWFSDECDNNVLKQVFNFTNTSVHNIVTIEQGTHYVSCLEELLAPINIDSNTDVNLIGKIKLLPNALSAGFVVNIVYGAENINIYGGGVIEGDKFEHDYQTGALALGNKIVSVNASSTPEGVVLYNGTEQITGTLESSQHEINSGNIYWVKNMFNNALDLSGETGYITTNYSYYQAISLVNAKGLIIYKWKAVNTCESCHGINMHECYNVSISNITIKNCAGDCIYIGYKTLPGNKISLTNLTLDNSRRQGISITSGQNILIDNCRISNINGTNPQAGIDIEPNVNSFITNLFIRNTTINDVSGPGISLHNTKIFGFDNIVIENVIIDGCSHGIGSKKTNVHGLSIKNVTVKNNDTYGLILSPYEKIAFDPEEEDGPYNVKDSIIENFMCDSRHDGADNVTNIIMGINISVNNCTFNGQTLLRSYLLTDTSHEVRGISASNCTFNAPDGLVQIHNACSVTGGTIICKHLRTPNGHTAIRDAKIIAEKISSTAFDAEEGSGASFITIENCYLECPYVYLNYCCSLKGNNLTLWRLKTGINTVIKSNVITFMDNIVDLPSHVNIDTEAYCNISFNRIVASNKGRSEEYRAYPIRLGSYNSFKHNVYTLTQATDDHGNNITTKLAAFLFIANNDDVSFNRFVISGTSTFVWRLFYAAVEYKSTSVLFSNTYDYDPALVEGEGYVTNNCTYRDASKNRFGTSEERPELTSLDISFEYFDTDLNKSIYWNGTRWIDEKGFTANISKGTYELAWDLILNNKLTFNDIGYEFYIIELERPVYYSLEKLYEYAVKLDYAYESNLLIENNTYYVEVSNSSGVTASVDIYFSKVNDNPTEEDLIPITNNSYIIAPDPSIYPYIYINGINTSTRRYIRIYTPAWVESISNSSNTNRIILRKNIVNGENILTLNMINQPNKIYVVQYDFKLPEETVLVITVDLTQRTIIDNKRYYYSPTLLNINLSENYNKILKVGEAINSNRNVAYSERKVFTQAENIYLAKSQDISELSFNLSKEFTSSKNISVIIDDDITYYITNAISIPSGFTMSIPENYYFLDSTGSTIIEIAENSYTNTTNNSINVCIGSAYDFTEVSYTIESPYIDNILAQETSIDNNIYFYDANTNAFNVLSGYTITVPTKYVVLNSSGTEVLFTPTSSDTNYTPILNTSIRIGELASNYLNISYTISNCITIPENCILEFEGGSINNGVLVGTDTAIIAPKTAIFTNIFIGGTWNVPEITSAWFSDAEENNVLKNVLALQNENVKNIITIEEGDYNVSVSDERESVLSLTSNTKIYIVGNIILAPNPFERYRIIRIVDANNVEISGGGSIVGDKEGHDYETSALALGTKVLSTDASNTPNTAKLYVDGDVIQGTLVPSAEIVDNIYWVKNQYDSGGIYTYYQAYWTGSVYAFQIVNTHQWGHGIYVQRNNQFLNIHDITIKDCTGDCICVGGLEGISKNVVIDNVFLDNSRRQGISVIDVNNIRITNSIITNVHGTKPQSGIDIEPNKNMICKNIVIDNVNISNCTLGLVIQGNKGSVENTSINNCRIENIDNLGVSIKNTKSVVNFTNNYISSDYTPFQANIGDNDLENVLWNISNNIFEATSETDALSPICMIFKTNTLFSHNKITGLGPAFRIYKNLNIEYCTIEVAGNFCWTPDGNDTVGLAKNTTITDSKISVRNFNIKGDNLAIRNNNISCNFTGSTESRDGGELEIGSPDIVSNASCFINNRVSARNITFKYFKRGIIKDNIFSCNDGQNAIGTFSMMSSVYAIVSCNRFSNFNFHFGLSNTISSNSFNIENSSPSATSYIIRLRGYSLFTDNTVKVLDGFEGFEGFENENLTSKIILADQERTIITNNYFNLGANAFNYLVHGSSNMNQVYYNNFIAPGTVFNDIARNIENCNNPSYNPRGAELPVLDNMNCDKGSRFYHMDYRKPFYWRGADFYDANGDPATAYRKEYAENLFQKGKKMVTNQSTNSVCPMTIEDDSTLDLLVVDVYAGDYIVIEGSSSSSYRLWALIDSSSHTIINKAAEDITAFGANKIVVKIEQNCILVVNVFNEEKSPKYNNNSEFSYRVTRFYNTL